MSARVGLNGAGSRMRSKPPERNFVASFHQRPSFFSCPEARVVLPHQVLVRWLPTISHRLTTLGHAPVEPLCCRCRSAAHPPWLAGWLPSAPVWAL